MIYKDKNNKTIFKEVFLRIKGRLISMDALIDTGASNSLIPISFFKETEQETISTYEYIIGVHGGEWMKKAIAEIKSPSLSLNDYVLNEFLLSEDMNYAIIGMDILSPLGVCIDTETGDIIPKPKNELTDWAMIGKIAFVTIVIGIIFFGEDILKFLRKYFSK